MLDTYKNMLEPEPSARWTLAKRGALGLAIFGVAGWMWRRNSTRSDDGDDSSRLDD